MAQSYLVLNQSGYYFRIIVPVDLRSMIGMREIKRSLKTGVLGLAKPWNYHQTRLSVLRVSIKTSPL
jgi:hypothetical protein